MAKKKGISEKKKNIKPVEAAETETVEAETAGTEKPDTGVSNPDTSEPENEVPEVETAEVDATEAERSEPEEAVAEEAAPEESSESLSVMEPGEVMSAIESILFAMGESVSIDKLAEVLEIEKGQVEDGIDALSERYDAPDCGLSIVRLEDSVQLCTKAENYDYLVKVTKAKPRFSLSDTVLETLSIIAYKQPVTKIEIEKIRGVSCDHAVNKLLEYDLIREFGRLDAPGKPILFGTTENFLRCFGVTSISDLPQITPDQVEEYKKEAEAEINVKLDI